MDVLNERQKTHGEFSDNARVAQALRAIWRQQPTWAEMPDVHREALDHIAGKIGRIFSGQATFYDHWRDVAGYATLAEKACQQPEQKHEPPLVSLRSGFLDTAGNWVNAPYEA